MKITKNGTVLDVTKGAFKSIFESQGWQLCKGNDQPNPQQFMSPHPVGEPENKMDAVADDIPFHEFTEQQKHPSFSERLENMTKNELVEYARQNGINVDGATKKEQIVSIIRAAIEE